MGMFDTIVFQKPIFCQCGTKIESTQTKIFDKQMEIYRVGDFINGSSMMSIMQEQAFCPKCDKHIQLYIAIKYEIYLGVFDNYNDAKNEIDIFDTMNILYYCKK